MPSADLTRSHAPSSEPDHSDRDETQATAVAATKMTGDSATVPSQSAWHNVMLVFRRLTASASAASEEPKAMSESAACAC